MFPSQQPQSQVRNACAACHRRKIRCITSGRGGPCHNCQLRRLSCYFLPRYRSGRPRLNELPPSTAAAIDHHDSAITLSYTTKARHSPGTEFFERPPHEDYSLPPEHQQDYGLHGSEQTLKSPPVADEILLEFQQHSRFPDFAGSTHSQHTFVDISDHEAVFETIPTPLSATIPTTAWPIPGQDPRDRGTSIEPRIKAFQEQAFSNLLRQCSKLQRHLLEADELSTEAPNDGNGFATPQRAEMLEDVEANCKLILEICEKGTGLFESTPSQVTKMPEKPHTPLLDPASISLITAVIFKTLQICNVFLNGAEKSASSIADLLLFKRLDVNITLVRIVMLKLEKLALDKMLPWQELSNRAVHIERRFAEKKERMGSSVL